MSEILMVFWNSEYIPLGLISWSSLLETPATFFPRKCSHRGTPITPGTGIFAAGASFLGPIKKTALCIKHGAITLVSKALSRLTDRLSFPFSFFLFAFGSFRSSLGIYNLTARCHPSTECSVSISDCIYYDWWNKNEQEKLSLRILCLST